MPKYYSFLNMQNADHFGYEEQSQQCMEECAELIQAINKHRRASGHGKRPKISEEEARKNLIEEIADVEVMLEQMKYLLAISQEEVDSIKVTKIIETEMSYNNMPG